MKYLLSLSLLLHGVLAASPVLAALDQAAYVSLAASVLRVEAPRQRGGFALGSAVALAPDKVVTNCHVTRDALRGARPARRRCAGRRAGRPATSRATCACSMCPGWTPSP